jgi:hypothetical protein
VLLCVCDGLSGALKALAACFASCPNGASRCIAQCWAAYCHSNTNEAAAQRKHSTHKHESSRARLVSDEAAVKLLVDGVPTVVSNETLAAHGIAVDDMLGCYFAPSFGCISVCPCNSACTACASDYTPAADPTDSSPSAQQERLELHAKGKQIEHSIGQSKERGTALAALPCPSAAVSCGGCQSHDLVVCGGSFATSDNWIAQPPPQHACWTVRPCKTKWNVHALAMWRACKT